MFQARFRGCFVETLLMSAPTNLNYMMLQQLMLGHP